MAERVERASMVMRMRYTAAVAVAAMVLLAGGLAIHSLLQSSSGNGGPIAHNDGGQPKLNTGSVSAVAVLTVEGPKADVPQGPAVEEITIGAGGAYAADASGSPYADEIDSRPGRVVIASGISPSIDRPQVGFPN
jgi:hypothetical protein